MSAEAVLLLDVDGVVNAFRAGWLGLPGLPRAFTGPVTGEEASLAKFTAAQDVIAGGRRLVWVDDVEVHTYAGKCAPWTAAGRALLVGPNPSRGLRTRDLRRIENFLSYPQGLP